MTVRIVPTLAAMAEIYRLPTDGGPESPRFKRYVELAKDGTPVSGYNPMTSKDALGTVEALLAIDAEEQAEDTANQYAEELGIEDDVDLSITVATPGAWTDRLATEIEHRLGGRRWKEIVLWTGEDVGEDSLRAVTTAQTVRVGWALLHRPPRSVAHAAGQEGLAAAVAEGDAGADAGASPVDDPADRSVAAALDVFGEETDLSSRAALLYGDEVARQFGWMPLGVQPSAGYGYAKARAKAALKERSAKELLRDAWTPGTTT
ncbi:MAG TPA: hypothetical protein VIL36_16500 [Acidimicrobiales bacterium]